ncbi:hypothetical protein AC579_512 [Pseudocercospora musae]|uniref:Uncharacterized protein n=1 Tax=Pseudocercospora musae TaxID=113226 RepID=A0A139I615_9PEZI|nr:hypothetical protein AC579_512 [Pseudocercospora musae]
MSIDLRYDGEDWRYIEVELVCHNLSELLYPLIMIARDHSVVLGRKRTLNSWKATGVPSKVIERIRDENQHPTQLCMELKRDDRQNLQDFEKLEQDCDTRLEANES